MENAKLLLPRILLDIILNVSVLFVIIFSVKILASCDMLLENFPMDTQHCFLILGSCKYRFITHGCVNMVIVEIKYPINYLNSVVLQMTIYSTDTIQFFFGCSHRSRLRHFDTNEQSANRLI